MNQNFQIALFFWVFACSNPLSKLPQKLTLNQCCSNTRLILVPENAVTSHLCAFAHIPRLLVSFPLREHLFFHELAYMCLSLMSLFTAPPSSKPICPCSPLMHRPLLYSGLLSLAANIFTNLEAL